MPVLFLSQARQPCKGTQTALSPAPAPPYTKYKSPLRDITSGSGDPFIFIKVVT